MRSTRSHAVTLSLLALAVGSVLALSGCNSSSDTAATTPTPASQPASSALIAGSYELNTNLGKPVSFVSFDGTQTSATPFQMTIGYGSAAFHNPNDTPEVFYAMTDRGPNIKCKDSGKAPVNIKNFCGQPDSTGTFVVDNDGKIFPAPFFDPTIHQITLVQQGGTMTPTVTKAIALLDQDGNQIGGLSNDLPARPADLTQVAAGAAVMPNTEYGYSNSAQRLPFNQNSLDTEGMVQLADGSFWIGEEYAPSIVHVAANGQILARIVPNDSGLLNPITGQSMSVCDALKNGTAATPAANYPVTCGLPDILDLRKLNRGIEDVAVSPDQKTLYFGMQSPLANPSEAAYKASRNARIFTVALNADGSFGKVTGEYVYQLDTPNTFPLDASTKQSDVKLSEMSVTPNGHLIQLERISKETKLYHVDLTGATNILGTQWDDRATQPSLAQQTDLAAAGIVPVKKTLVFDTAKDAPDATTIGKIEGVAFLNSDYLLLTNDNDFGISGDPSMFYVIKAAAQVSQ